jgi:hypothetical protein
MLMRGMLMSFSDPNLGRVPTLVPFQYNPAEVTRTITVNRTADGQALTLKNYPTESYTLKLELDGVDAVDKPITSVMGIQPLLAAIEAMLEPTTRSRGVIGAVGSALTGAVSVLTGGASSSIQDLSLPLVVLAWSASRIAPVRIDSYIAHETGFNAALLPVQATVDLSLTVLRNRDLTSDLKLANFMAYAYQAARSALAITGVAQGVELMS